MNGFIEKPKTRRNAMKVANKKSLKIKVTGAVVALVLGLGATLLVAKSSLTESQAPTQQVANRGIDSTNLDQSDSGQKAGDAKAGDAGEQSGQKAGDAGEQSGGVNGNWSPDVVIDRPNGLPGEIGSPAAPRPGANDRCLTAACLGLGPVASPRAANVDLVGPTFWYVDLFDCVTHRDPLPPGAGPNEFGNPWWVLTISVHSVSDPAGVRSVTVNGFATVRTGNTYVATFATRSNSGTTTVVLTDNLGNKATMAGPSWDDFDCGIL
jgi:hypothetical protein